MVSTGNANVLLPDFVYLSFFMALQQGLQFVPICIDCQRPDTLRDLLIMKNDNRLANIVYSFKYVSVVVHGRLYCSCKGAMYFYCEETLTTKLSQAIKHKNQRKHTQ